MIRSDVGFRWRFVLLRKHQLTTVGTRRYNLRIDPAYQYAYINARKKWRGVEVPLVIGI